MTCAGTVSMRQADAARQADRPARPGFIRIESIHKSFTARQGGSLTVLDSIDLDIAENEFVSLIGRSGCGKTTLLNIIAGLDEATSGRIAIEGRPVTGPGQGQGAGRRPVACCEHSNLPGGRIGSAQPLPGRKR